MKQLRYLFLLSIISLFSACGGGEQTSKQGEDTQNTTAQDSPEVLENKDGQALCFASQEGLTQLYMNLYLNEDQISGTAEYITPKSDRTLFSVCELEGTKENNTFQLQFKVTEANDGVEVGTQYDEIWTLEGDQLLASYEDALILSLNKITCDPEADTERMAIREAEEEFTPSNEFYYEGVINDKLKIQMFLVGEPDFEDDTRTLITGYYYYESQGADKTIELEGSLVDQIDMPSFLVEVKDGKEYGRFVIEPGFTLGQSLECLWVSADGSKEYTTLLTPSE